MAHKSFATCSSRDKGFLIGQYYKLINYYNEFYCPRTRSYLRDIAEKDGSIYWIQGDHKQLVAAAIVDPNHIIEINGVKFHTLSHTISTRPGSINRVLEHIFNDHLESNIISLSRPLVAQSIGLLDHNFTEIPYDDVHNLCPELSEYKTDYFNTKNESLKNGITRRKMNLYIKASGEDKTKVQNLWPKLNLA